MNSLRRSRVPLLVLNFVRQNVRYSQTFRLSSTTSSVRAIEVPTSQTTIEQGSLPVTAECPAPTCACGEMPTGLDIDYKKPIRGTMPRYTRHVVIHTGQDDWESKIENGTVGVESGEGVNIARVLKELMGPKGKYHNVCTCQMDLHCNL